MQIWILGDMPVLEYSYHQASVIGDKQNSDDILENIKNFYKFNGWPHFPLIGNNEERRDAIIILRKMDFSDL